MRKTLAFLVAALLVLGVTGNALAADYGPSLPTINRAMGFKTTPSRF